MTTDRPIQGDTGVRCSCGGPMLRKRPDDPTSPIECPRCGKTPLDLVKAGAPVDHDVARWDEWPERTLVVIACSAAKLDRAAPAAQLYTGTLFTLALRAARALTDDSWIRVMSAKHGFVSLDTELEPYDRRIVDENAVKVGVMRAQAARLDPQPDAVVLLTPKAYTTRGQLVWPDAACPLEGALGIGEIRQRLAIIARRGIEEPDEYATCPVTYRLGCGCRAEAPPTPARKRLVIGQLVQCAVHGDRHVTSVSFRHPEMTS